MSPWPAFDGPLTKIPKTRAEVVATYGDPGLTHEIVDGKWERAQLITVRDLPGVPTKWYFRVHRLVEPYMREAFRRAQLAAPTYTITRAGCFNFRRKQHDTLARAMADHRPLRSLSIHAWGAAVDIDSDLNGALSFDPKTNPCPTPWSPAWMKRWPKGLPQPFVEAFESVGFTWGGRWTRYCDPMHFQLVGGDADV